MSAFDLSRYVWVRLWLTDASFHKMIIDLLAGVLCTGGLDNVDIFSTDCLFDFAPGFSDRELGQDAIALRNAENVADIIDKLGVGVSPQNDEISHHIWDLTRRGLRFFGVATVGSTLDLENKVRSSLLANSESSSQAG